MIRLYSFCFAMAFVSSAYGLDLSACRTLTDEKARLACFDKAAQPTKSAAARTSAKLIVTDDQNKFASILDAQLLASSLDIRVGVLTEGLGKQAKYPILYLLGYLDRPLVNKLMTDFKLLAAARQHGFLTIYFSGKGPGGNWIFEVNSTSGRICSSFRNDLCYE